MQLNCHQERQEVPCHIHSLASHTQRRRTRSNAEKRQMDGFDRKKWSKILAKFLHSCSSPTAGRFCRPCPEQVSSHITRFSLLLQNLCYKSAAKNGLSNTSPLDMDIFHLGSCQQSKIATSAMNAFLKFFLPKCVQNVSKM